MAIISGGEWRGRVLPSKVPSGVRPTSSRVREAIFSILGQDLSEVRFLDGYGGTGIMGIEAASRGADVVLVERSNNAMRAIIANGEAVGAAWTTRVGDVERIASSLGQFDVVFLDPPYLEEPERVLNALSQTLLVDGLLLYEAAKQTLAPEECAGLILERIKPYGNSQLLFYRHATA